MLKLVFIILISTLSVSVFSGSSIHWQTMPVPNYQPNYQLYSQGEQQVQNGVNQLSNAVTEYAKASAQQQYDRVVHNIRQSGGTVERSGDNIYITTPDGNKMYCYAVISEKSCELSNY